MKSNSLYFLNYFKSLKDVKLAHTFRRDLALWYVPMFYGSVDTFLTTTQGVGVGLTALRQGLVLSSIAIRRRMLVSLEINNKDPSYDWFLAWMSRQAQEPQPRGIARYWTRSHQLSVQTLHEQHKNGSSSVLFKLVAGPGTHLLRYQRAWIQVRLLLL